MARDERVDGLLDAWLGSRRAPEWAVEEAQVERMVSAYIGGMPFLWLEVPTLRDGTSPRGHIERNCIALLSCATGAGDQPSQGWLGHRAASVKVTRSGLWNVNHVEEAYDPAFLGVLTELVRQARWAAPQQPSRS